MKQNFAKYLGARRRLWVFLATVILITIVLYWRRPDAFVNPQFWAEDGELFFTDSYFTGLKKLFVPYRGIYHVLGRLVAWPGRFLPLALVPAYYYFMSWLMLVALSGYIFSDRLPVSLTTKFFMSLALVANAADHEVFFNLANWTTISAVWWLLLAIASIPVTRWGQLLDGGLLVLNGANAAFSVVLWPLFILRWWQTRDRFHAVLAIMASVAGAVQLSNMFGRIPSGTFWPQFGPKLADVLIARFGFMFVGSQIFWLPSSNTVRVLGSLVMVAVLGSLLIHSPKRGNWRTGLIILGGIFCAVLSIYTKRLENPEVMLRWSGRHYYLPVVTMAWGYLLWNPTNRWLKWIPLGLMAATFLFFTPEHKRQVFPDLDWAGEVAACQGTRTRCLIPIPPVWEPLRWFATIDSHIFTEPAYDEPLMAEFADQIELRGYSVRQNEQEIELELVWFVLEEPAGSYTQFVHLGETGREDIIAAQVDRLPLNGEYPTGEWRVGEFIVEQFVFPLDSLPLGEYALFVGWYDAASAGLPRLSAASAAGERWDGDRVRLPTTVFIK